MVRGMVTGQNFRFSLTFTGNPFEQLRRKSRWRGDENMTCLHLRQTCTSLAISSSVQVETWWVAQTKAEYFQQNVVREHVYCHTMTVPFSFRTHLSTYHGHN